jgi:aconitate hydratase
MVLVKSFARIHETNLKRQGVLPLTFETPEDYDLIQEEDKFSLDATKLSQGPQLSLTLFHANGSKDTIQVRHSLNELQLQWILKGSALNYVRAKLKKAS